MALTTPSDHDLLQRVQERDVIAFEALFARYREPVRRHLTRIVRNENAADDLAQEVFLRVWTRAEQWDGRGAVRGWLFRIATNLALNHLRSLRRRREQPLEMPLNSLEDDEQEALTPAWMVDTAAPGPEMHAEMAEQQARLRRLVEGLPEEKREVFRLVHEAEMEMREVAEALGIPEGTVKSRLHHAKKRLARQWREVETEWGEEEIGKWEDL